MDVTAHAKMPKADYLQDNSSKTDCVSSTVSPPLDVSSTTTGKKVWMVLSDPFSGNVQMTAPEDQVYWSFYFI